MTNNPPSDRPEAGFSHISEHARTALFRALPDAVGITHATLLLDVNDAFLRLLKCRRDDVIGKSFCSLLSPDDANMLINRQIRREQGETVDELVEYTIPCFDGSSVIVEASTVWIPEEDMLITILREVTERRRFQDELEKSKQLLRNVVESIPIGIWVADKDFNIKLWNVGQEMMTGVCRDEVVGKNIFELFPSLKIAGLEDMYRQVLATGESLILSNFPFYDETLTRVSYYLNIKASALRDSDGKIAGIVLAVEDITEQKKSEERATTAEKALGISETRFRIAAQSCSDLIYEWDVDSGRVEWFGDIDAKLGYAPGEFPRTVDAWEQIVHPDDHDRVIKESKRHALDGKYLMEYRIIRKDGSVLHWTETGVVVQDRTGSHHRWIGAVTDITERKMAEQALRQSEQQFRLAFDNAPIGMVLVGMDDKCLRANQALADIVGYTPEELKQMTFQEVTHPDDLPTNLELVQKLLKGEIPKYRLSKRYIHKDGHLVDVVLNVSLVRDEQGKPLHGIVQIEDVTEHKKAEEAVHNSLAALEKAYALQSEFVRNMTHEVRTPLTGVIGCARALLDGMAGTTSEEQRKVLRRIVEQAESLLAIVEEVLESARLAAGVKRLDLRVLRLDEVVKSAAQMAEYTARERKISIDAQVAADLPAVVSDPQKLTRVLNNLISNAVKFTFKGSVTIMAERDGDGVDIVVVDTGTGIREDRQEHIFDAFVQLSYPGKHKPVGAGLGLSIVRELVDALGCSLVLSSIPGEGTAFTLHVPLRHTEMK